MSKGSQKADELNVPVYTGSSMSGYGLYIRHRFREVDRVTVDLEQWGGEKGEFNSYALLLRPANREELERAAEA